MISFGFNFGFAGFQAYQPLPPAQLPQPAATTATPPASTPAHAVTPAPVSYMTPAFVMAYPQMNFAQMGAAPAGMGGSPGMATATGGHVTANSTNSTATQQGAMPGQSGMSGMPFMYGMPVMPMMMMAPVLIAFGYPTVFQGSQPQPTLPVAPAAAEVPIPDEPSPQTPAVDAVPQPPVISTARPTVDVVPAAGDLPGMPINELTPADYARYRSVEKAMEQESSLQLELTTKDGDTITLQFKQSDSVAMSRFRGHTLDGGMVRNQTYREDSDRVVTMQVAGELSADERAAIDTVLSTVIDVVNSFFTGKVGDAVDKLKAMDFDGEQLAELSLNMSMSKSVGIDRAYHNGENSMHQLKSRDGDVATALDFMASEQKRLVEMAKSVLDAPSAARLVRSLVPPMMSAPFAELVDKIDAANAVDESEESEKATSEG